MGDCIRSTVRKAAKLAVYEEIMISVKNHQTLPTIRPDIDLETDVTACRLTRPVESGGKGRGSFPGPATFGGDAIAQKY